MRSKFGKDRPWRTSRGHNRYRWWGRWSSWQIFPWMPCERKKFMSSVIFCVTRGFLRSLFAQIFHAILVAVLVFAMPVWVCKIDAQKKVITIVLMYFINHQILPYHASMMCLMTAVTLWTGSPIISRPIFCPTLRKLFVFRQSSFSVVHDRAWSPATYDRSSFHRSTGIRAAGA